MGQGLMQDLSCVADQLERRFTGPDVESAENAVRERLQEWGSKTAGHYGEKTAEVKQLLLCLRTRPIRSANGTIDAAARCAK